MTKQSKSSNDYEKLHQISREARILSGISSLLEWDQETYMPSGGTEIRAEQLKLMAGLAHKVRTGSGFSKALGKLIDLKSGKILAKEVNERQKAAIREWYRDFRHDKALPSKFVQDFAQLSSVSQLAWRRAKKENNFKLFAPYLDKIIQMNQKKADLFGYKDHPYDALLDVYEPNITSKEIKSLFFDVRKEAMTLLKIINKAPEIDDSFLNGTFDTEKQVSFGKELLKDMGYEMNKGRLDFSSHPFSSASHPTDSRVTTRIHPTSVLSNISVILHEGGHGMYEMGLPEEEYGTPLGEARSLGIHESQSRWWETRIGQSLPFWKFYLPKLQKSFKGKLDHVNLKQFYRAVNKVKPTLIRVEADEVTYSLHVILRFELEMALIEGKLKVKDLPEAWNAKMDELLGIVPSSDSEGCLQDIHWSMGAFGYFPTYTLGNLYAAHLFEKFKKVYPQWEKRVENGDLLFIKQWLHDNIYRFGREYTSHELLEKATGAPFSAKAFASYIKDKYISLYKS